MVNTSKLPADIYQDLERLTKVDSLEARLILSYMLIFTEKKYHRDIVSSALSHLETIVTKNLWKTELMIDILFDPVTENYHGDIIASLMPHFGTIIKKDPSRAQAMIKNMRMSTDPNLYKDVITGMIAYASIIKGQEDLVDTIAEHAYCYTIDGTIAAEQTYINGIEGYACETFTVSAASPSKKGYASESFTVLAASPKKRRHTIIIKNPDQNSQALIMTGRFHGTCADFQTAIQRTHPDGQTKDRKHYNAVLDMARRFERRLST